MKVSLYDIISKIIPGGLLFMSLYLCFEQELKDLSGVIQLIVIYFLGFLIEIVASLSERKILFPSFGDNPAKMLLENHSF